MVFTQNVIITEQLLKAIIQFFMVTPKHLQESLEYLENPEVQYLQEAPEKEKEEKQKRKLEMFRW